MNIFHTVLAYVDFNHDKQAKVEQDRRDSCHEQHI